MKIQPCKCCQEGRHGHREKSTGYGYNRLDGEARRWAATNRFAMSEYCVPVKDGKRFGGPNWQKRVCGDGRMGFSTRRKGQEDVHMENGLDGQMKKKRDTLVRPRSARATATRRARRVDGSRVGLVSSVTIAAAMSDPIVTAQKRVIGRKFKRACNRNGAARRGRKRTMEMVK